MTSTKTEFPNGIPSVAEMRAAHAKAVEKAKAAREYKVEYAQGVALALSHIDSPDGFGDYMRYGVNEKGEWDLSSYIERGSSLRDIERRNLLWLA